MGSLTEKEIREIEHALGSPMPAAVSQSYRVSNGLRGPTDCCLLYNKYSIGN
jgi:hypothetical protein